MVYCIIYCRVEITNIVKLLTVSKLSRPTRALKSSYYNGCIFFIHHYFVMCEHYYGHFRKLGFGSWAPSDIFRRRVLLLCCFKQAAGAQVKSKPVVSKTAFVYKWKYYLAYRRSSSYIGYCLSIF